jgi:geranylgeranylglycerol-phosphate geranylgeranyltransferase
MTAGANIINDLFDLEIDRINKPERLLASGKVSIWQGKLFFICSYATGIFFSLIAGRELFFIALIFAALLYWYSFKLKRVMLWGNFIVSLATGFAFIYGALAAQNWKAGIIPAIFAFFFHFGREIVKDMEDVLGDSVNNAKTLPVIRGYKTSAMVVIILFGLLIILTIIPYILDIYNLIYLIIVIIGVDCVLLAVSILIWKQQKPQMLHKISLILKIDMVVGLLAIYLG